MGIHLLPKTAFEPLQSADNSGLRYPLERYLPPPVCVIIDNEVLEHDTVKHSKRGNNPFQGARCFRCGTPGQFHSASLCKCRWCDTYGHPEGECDYAYGTCHFWKQLISIKEGREKPTWGWLPIACKIKPTRPEWDILRGMDKRFKYFPYTPDEGPIVAPDGVQLVRLECFMPPTSSRNRNSNNKRRRDYESEDEWSEPETKRRRHQPSRRDPHGDDESSPHFLQSLHDPRNASALRMFIREAVAEASVQTPGGGRQQQGNQQGPFNTNRNGDYSQSQSGNSQQGNYQNPFSTNRNGDYSQSQSGNSQQGNYQDPFSTNRNGDYPQSQSGNSQQGNQQGPFNTNHNSGYPQQDNYQGPFNTNHNSGYPQQDNYQAYSNPNHNSGYSQQDNYQAYSNPNHNSGYSQNPAWEYQQNSYQAYCSPQQNGGYSQNPNRVSQEWGSDGPRYNDRDGGRFPQSDHWNHQTGGDYRQPHDNRDNRDNRDNGGYHQAHNQGDGQHGGRSDRYHDSNHTRGFPDDGRPSQSRDNRHGDENPDHSRDTRQPGNRRNSTTGRSKSNRNDTGHPIRNPVYQDRSNDYQSQAGGQNSQQGSATANTGDDPFKDDKERLECANWVETTGGFIKPGVIGAARERQEAKKAYYLAHRTDACFRSPDVK